MVFLMIRCTDLPAQPRQINRHAIRYLFQETKGEPPKLALIGIVNKRQFSYADTGEPLLQLRNIVDDIDRVEVPIAVVSRTLANQRSIPD